MKRKSAYLQGLREAIEANDHVATEYHLSKVMSHHPQAIHDYFDDGQNIIGVTLNNYFTHHDNEILNLILQGTPPSVWLQGTQQGLLFPHELAILRNDAPLFRKITIKNKFELEHSEYENHTSPCDHLACIQSLLSDQVSYDTFDQLLDDVLDAYESCYNRGIGDSQASTPLLTQLLSPKATPLTPELSQLKLQKYERILASETSQDLNKMHLLLEPWHHDVTHSQSFRDSTQLKDHFNPNQNPLSLALATGQVKIASDILKTLSVSKPVWQSTYSGKSYIKTPEVMTGYLQVALTQTQSNLEEIIELLIHYKTRITLTTILNFTELLLKRDLSVLSSSHNQKYDTIVSMLLGEFKVKDEVNLKHTIFSSKTENPIKLRLGNQKCLVEGTLFAILTLLGYSRSIRSLTHLCDFREEDLANEPDILSHRVTVRTAKGTRQISLVSLALLNGNLAAIQEVMDSHIESPLLHQNIPQILGEIQQAGEMPSLNRLFNFMHSIANCDSILIRHILDYVFQVENCITDTELERLCQEYDQKSSSHNPSTPPIFLCKYEAGVEVSRQPWHFGSFKLPEFRQARALVAQSQKILLLGKQLLESLYCIKQVKIAWDSESCCTPNHAEACQALGLADERSTVFFDVLRCVYSIRTMPHHGGQRTSSSITAVLTHLGMYYLLHANRHYSLNNKDTLARLVYTIISSQQILSHIDMILVQRLAKALMLKPPGINQVLCINNDHLTEMPTFSPFEYLLNTKRFDHNAALAITDPELFKTGYYTFINNNFHRLPLYPQDYHSIDRLALRLITTLTYHATNSSVNTLQQLASVNYKCHVILSVLPKIDQKFKAYDSLDAYYTEQYRLEGEVSVYDYRGVITGDYLGEELSEDSDEQLDEKPLNLYENRYFEEVVATAQADQLTDTSGKLKTILKFDSEGKPKQNKNGGLDYDKRKLKVEPHKRARTTGETKLGHYPPEKFQKTSGITTQTSEDIERHVQTEIARINAQYNRGQANYFANVTTPFFLHFTRGVHYNRVDWNADQRRQHRALAEDIEKPGHYANALFSDCGMSISAGALIDKRTASESLAPKAALLQQNLLTLRQETEPDGLYHALHQLYSANYDGFKAFLENCIDKHSVMPEEYKDIATTINQYFLNCSNHFLSTAGTPYHALKYAYGLKTYPGHQEERLRPRWRRDGRAERPYSGKAYIYLLTLQQYAELNPYDIPSQYDKGNSGLVSVYRAERETSFMGSIPEGCILMQHIAKYPSFNGPYKPAYFAKYGLTPELYALFGNAFKHSAPHSSERQNAKTLLGEWLCAFHEVRILKEITARVIDMGGVILYHNMDGFSTHLPKVIDSSNAQKTAIRSNNVAQEQIDQMRGKITDMSKLELRHNKRARVVAEEEPQLRLDL